MIIALEGMEFFSRHGVHSFEREKGNYFIVDVELEYSAEEASVNDELSSTLDYSEVYSIVKEEMDIPARLLEAVSRRIHDKILLRFPQADNVVVSVSKLHPPVGGTCYRARVVYTKEK